MRPVTRERGSALIATLAATAVLVPLAAFAVLLTRADFYIHHNTRAEVEAFYTAEAGLEHALSEIPSDVAFTRLVHGPDGLPGTPDDGDFPFREAAPDFFPRAPLRYRVRVEFAKSGLLRITSTGDGVRNARVQIEALVARDPAPYVPAALYVPDVGGFSIGPEFLVSGFDHAPGDPAEQPTGTAPPAPALAAGDESVAEALRDQLGPDEADRLVGSGGTPSVADSGALDVTALANTLATLPIAVHLPTSALSPTAQLGTADTPQITVLTDGGQILGNVSGVGVLIAPAGLRVGGRLTFSGVVLALGDVVSGSDSFLHLDGTVWMGALDGLVSLAGQGAVTYDHEVVAKVDRRHSGYLPHVPFVASWREVL